MTSDTPIKLTGEESDAVACATLTGPTDYKAAMVYWHERAMTAEAALAAANARADANEKDAERYRWLRDGEYPVDLLDKLIAPGIHRDAVDAAIDAAIAAKEKP